MTKAEEKYYNETILPELNRQKLSPNSSYGIQVADWMMAGFRERNRAAKQKTAEVQTSLPELIVTPTKTTIGNVTHIPETTAASFTPEEKDQEYLDTISTSEPKMINYNPTRASYVQSLDKYGYNNLGNLAAGAVTLPMLAVGGAGAVGEGIALQNAFATQFPKLSAAIDAYLTYQGVKNLATGEGVQKTARLFKDGKYGRAALSGLGDILDLSGGLNLAGRTVRGIDNAIDYGRQWKQTFKNQDEIREKINKYIRTLAKKYPTEIKGGANYHVSTYPIVTGQQPVGNIPGGDYTWQLNFDHNTSQLDEALKNAHFESPPSNFAESFDDYKEFFGDGFNNDLNPVGSFLPALGQSFRTKGVNRGGTSISFNPANYITTFYDGFLGKKLPKKFTSGIFAHEVQHSVQGLRKTPLAKHSANYYVAPKNSPYAEFFGKPTQNGISYWEQSPREFDSELVNWRLQNDNWVPVAEMDQNSYNQLRDFLQDRFWKNGQIKHGSEAVKENIQSIFNWLRYGEPIKWNNIKELYSVPDNAADQVLKIGSQVGDWKQGGKLNYSNYTK